ncbi:flagellin [Dethiosulfatarculus sandiegensis]|nr:flagellin [Dethiosulfatarculus sandiegensis]
MQRVTHMTLYRQTSLHLTRLREGQLKMSEQYSSGMRINQPSDDSLGSIITQHAHRRQEELARYGENVKYSLSWLQQSISIVDSMNQELTQLKGKAEQMATGTYSADQRRATAAAANARFQQLISLANTELSGNHIFSGSMTDKKAASLVMRPDEVATGHPTNAGEGGLYGSGDYTGVYSRTVQMTVVSSPPAGTDISAADPLVLNVRYVDDYGRQIDSEVEIETAGAGAAVHIGDGILIAAEDKDYAVGDTFTLSAGYYEGNQELMDVNLSWDNRMRYNYTMEMLYGAQGYSKGGWSNTLDLLAGWENALTKDGKVHDYFEAVSNLHNNLTTTALPKVTGEWADISSKQIEMNVGGPIQTYGDDEDLALYRNFSIDGGYAGGVPDEDNPMNITYEWWDGAAWQNRSTVIGVNAFTGTGSENRVVLAEGLEIFVANAAYQPGDPQVGDPPVSLDGFQLSPVHDFTITAMPADPPTEANPMTLSYEYWDGSAWVNQSVDVTGYDEENKVTLKGGWELSIPATPPGTYAVGDTYQFNPTHNQSSEPSQTDPQTITYTYKGADGVRHYQMMTVTSTGEDEKLLLGGMDRFSSLTGAYEADSITAALDTLSIGNEVEVGGFQVLVEQGGVERVFNVSVDPTTDSITDLANNINAAVNPTLDPNLGPIASVEDGKLKIEASEGIKFGMANDTSGALEALGMDYAQVSVYFDEGAVMDDFDAWDVSLEQYNQGQEKSQELLPLLDQAMTRLLSHSADGGSRQNRLEVRVQLLADDKLNSDERLKDHEDADPAEVVTNLKMYEIMYQASLQATASLTSRTLADYL